MRGRIFSTGCRLLHQRPGQSAFLYRPTVSGTSSAAPPQLRFNSCKAPLTTIQPSTSPRARPFHSFTLDYNTQLPSLTYSTHQRTFSAATMSPVPKTMKAVQFSRTGGVEVLEYNDVPVPSPVPEGHVLIRNRFAGVNYIDTYFRSGLYKAPNLPLTLGREGSGEVVEVHSSVSGDALAPGTPVVYMSVGSYAEYVAVPADKVLPVPDGVSLEEAAAAMLQGLTALTLVREAANVQPGQWTLVHAAAGGVGILLVQILRALGAKVIGTASTDEKCALARKHGAEWTINSNDDVVAKVNEITNGHGIDAILDGVGKATFEADLKMVALKGHLVSFGNASGAVPPVNLLDLSAKNVKLVRPTLFGYLADRADWEKYTTELFDLVASKKLEILIHKVYDLADAGSAHTDIESRKTTGKLLIKCD